MKKLIIALLSLSFGVNAQNIKTDSKGNYYQVKTDTARASAAKPTGKTFTDSKGVVYPVMLSKNGKLFYVKTAKTSGNKYNVYITL